MNTSGSLALAAAAKSWNERTLLLPSRGFVARGSGPVSDPRRAAEERERNVSPARGGGDRQQL